MSPIDDELRTMLRTHADDMPTEHDLMAVVETRARSIHRRRVAVATTTGGLAVAAVAMAGSLALTGSAHDSLRTRPVPPGLEPSATASAAPSADRLLDWPLRENTPGVALSYVGNPLWAGFSPRHDLLIVGQAPQADGSVNSQISVSPANGGQGYALMYGTIAPGTKQLSFIIGSGKTSYVVVVGAPETGQIRYAADGKNFRPEDTVQGVAVFPRTWTRTSPLVEDAIEVLDGNGDVDHPLYRGPIDPGPSTPGK